MNAQLFRRIRFKAKSVWWRVTVYPALRALGVDIPESARIQGRPIVSMTPGSRIQIGARCVLCSDSRMNALGVNHPVVLRTMRAGAEIVIGDDTGMSGGTICAMKSVRIGAGCLIGANVTLADTDFHSLNPVNRRYNVAQAEIAASPIVIENNVFIGAGAFILKGVTIGRNSVIGAGAVVTRDVPANAIAAGNPARVVKDLDLISRSSDSPANASRTVLNP